MFLWSKEKLVIFLAFLLSLIITRLMIIINIKDIPVDRSSHNKITPRAGGIGLLGGFYGSLFIQGFSHLPFYEDLITLIILLFCAAVIALTGLFDDIKGLNPIIRFFMQGSMAWLVVNYIGSFQSISLPYFNGINLSPFSSLISILWIVGFTNAFNFMDGLNGMAGVMTIISCLFLAIIAYVYQLDVVIFLILSAATCGFLVFNFPKAKIFLGDAGSLFLGFFFSSWSLWAFRSTQGKFSIWIMPLLFFIYIYDVILTCILRASRGKNIFEAHCEHLYQLLNNKLGWSHVQVTGLYALIFLMQGIACLFMIRYPEKQHILFFVPFLIGAIIFSWWIFFKIRKLNNSL